MVSERPALDHDASPFERVRRKSRYLEEKFERVQGPLQDLRGAPGFGLLLEDDVGRGRGEPLVVVLHGAHWIQDLGHCFVSDADRVQTILQLLSLGSDYRRDRLALVDHLGHR